MQRFLQSYCPYNSKEIERDLAKAYQGVPLRYEEDIVLPAVQDWIKEPYEANPFMPERLVHRTLKGKLVRSKSEAIIADILEMWNVPFRYEAALKLGGDTFYPDFTILHPANMKITYWEHFGMVGNERVAVGMTCVNS